MVVICTECYKSFSVSKRDPDDDPVCPECAVMLNAAKREMDRLWAGLEPRNTRERKRSSKDEE